MGVTLGHVQAPDQLPALLAELAGGGTPLPQVLCLVPNGRVAHRLRAHGNGLSGASLRTALELASDLLLASGEPVRVASEHHRALALEALFLSALEQKALRYFKVDQLRSGPGYAEAFASTISELEAAGLEPGDLRKRAGTKEAAPSAQRILDLATIWEQLERGREASCFRSPAWILRRAARVLKDSPHACPLQGAIAAFIDETTPNTVLEFLAALPDLTWLYLDARPIRPQSRERLDHIFSILDQTTRELRKLSRPELPSRPRELDLLKSFLFQAPRPADKETRPRSKGPDKSLELEQFAGVEDEIHAAVEWVSRKLLDQKLPLEEVALLLPSLDPYCAILMERLSALPWENELPLYVASGLPAATRAGAARVKGLLNALSSALNVEWMAKIIPYLRLSETEDRKRKHLTFSEAMELAYSCGTLGGLAGAPGEAKNWKEKLAERERSLVRSIEERRDEQNDDPEELRHARDLRENERMLSHVRAIRPAVDALVDTFLGLLDGKSFEQSWQSILEFARKWLLLPREPYSVLKAMERELKAIVEAGVSRKLGGTSTLRMLEKTLSSLRVPIGRYGKPQLYVGSVDGAVGLSFRAIRILGLCEGALPSNVQVDPILPDAVREQLNEGKKVTVPLRGQRSEQQLRAFYRVVQGAKEELVLSFARQSIEGTVKEPSGVFLEAAAAVGRAEGKGESRIPTVSDLRKLYFEKARLEAPTPPGLSAHTLARSVAARGSLEAAALPFSWRSEEDSSRDLARFRELVLRAGEKRPGAMDGILQKDWPLPFTRGLSKERPVSATRLGDLLACPYRFLLKNIFGWDEPPSPPPTREIGQPMYGGLLHRVAETFFKKYGKDFTKRKGSREDFVEKARDTAHHVFEAFIEEYPLLAEAVRRQQEDRLARDFLALLDYEWHNRGNLDFVAAEREFGVPDGLELACGEGGALFVRGYIDRLDTCGGRLLIRDVKSGSPKPRKGREANPLPRRDAQLALYSLVAEALRQSRRVDWPQPGGAAYAYPSTGRTAERAFEGDDFTFLLEEGRLWLSVAASLLRAQAFPRTIDGEDCMYCSFDTLCGLYTCERAREKLLDSTGSLKNFLAMKEKYL